MSKIKNDLTRGTEALAWLGLVVLAIVSWFLIAIPAIVVWYIWKKSKLTSTAKTKWVIATVLLSFVVIVMSSPYIFSETSDTTNPLNGIEDSNADINNYIYSPDSSTSDYQSTYYDAQQKVDKMTDWANIMHQGLGFKLIEVINMRENTAILTVSNLWHIRSHQLRLQDAQVIWEAWARISNPNNPDHARIELVDGMGNKVGGSSWLAGSLVSVKK